MISEKIQSKPRKQRRIVDLCRSDSEWQEVRASLVGRWIKDPQWCINQICGYLNRRFYDEPSCQVVHNYLTSSGFRSGIITISGGKFTQDISTLRIQVANQLKEKFKTIPLQMMPTHDHEFCGGYGCSECKWSGLIPGKKNENHI